MEKSSPSVREAGRLGLYIFLLFLVAIFVGILFWANRLDAIEWQDILWSSGLAGLLIAKHRLRDRATPPSMKTAPASDTYLGALVAGYVGYFAVLVLVPDSTELIDAVFERFWPLILGWVAASLVRVVYFIKIHGDRSS